MDSKKKIQLQEISPPNIVDEESDIEWLCRSLNLFTKKDSDKTTYKIFKILATSSLEGSPKTSAEIAEELRLARGTVLFHMKKFSQRGLVSRAPGRRYILRSPSLEETITDMMRDSERIFERMRRIAAEIDLEMGIEKRW